MVSWRSSLLEKLTELLLIAGLFSTKLNNPPYNQSSIKALPYSVSEAPVPITREKGDLIFSLYDLYANNQLFMVLSSHDATKLSIDINNYQEWILKEFNNNIKKNILYDLHKEKQNKDIVDQIENKFKINLFIDQNYQIIKDSDNFLWIGRGFPYRWIVIFSIDKININSDNYVQIIRDTLEKKLNNVIISDYKLLLVQNDVNLVLRGVYEHSHSDTGGPFFTYIFENISNNEVIFVSGFVNNPGKNKVDILEQLETIITNIKDK